MSKHAKRPLVLSITPSPKGFGFAVLDGETLVDWGVKVIPGANHAKCLLKVEKLMAHYHPDLLAMEDHKKSQRSGRIRSLMRAITETALGRKIKLKLFTRGQIYKTLCADGRKSKNALAEALVERFPNELGFRLPRKRRDWTSEDYRMVMFDAVALALMASD
jgi:hypothetical protein